MDVNKLNHDFSSQDFEGKSDFTADIHLDEEAEGTIRSSFNRYKFMAMGAVCLLGVQVLAVGALYVFYGSPQLSIESNRYDGLDIKTGSTLQEEPTVKDSYTELAAVEKTPFPDIDGSNISLTNNFHTEESEHQVEQVSVEVSNDQESDAVHVEAELTELLPEPGQDAMVSLVSEAFSYERKLSELAIEQQEPSELETLDHNGWLESDAALTSLSSLDDGREELPIEMASAEDTQVALPVEDMVEVAEIQNSQYDSYSEREMDTGIASDDVLADSDPDVKPDDLSQPVTSISAGSDKVENVEVVVSNDLESLMSAVDDSESINNSVPQWVLKVAAFRSLKNAISLQAELQKQGIDTYIESVDSDKGEIFRIYAGPAVSDFKEVKAMIKKEYGISAGEISRFKG